MSETTGFLRAYRTTKSFVIEKKAEKKIKITLKDKDAEIRIARDREITLNNDKNGNLD